MDVWIGLAYVVHDKTDSGLTYWFEWSSGLFLQYLGPAHPQRDLNVCVSRVLEDSANAGIVCGAVSDTVLMRLEKQALDKAQQRT